MKFITIEELKVKMVKRLEEECEHEVEGKSVPEGQREILRQELARYFEEVTDINKIAYDSDESMIYLITRRKLARDD